MRGRFEPGCCASMRTAARNSDAAMITDNGPNPPIGAGHETHKKTAAPFG